MLPKAALFVLAFANAALLSSAAVIVPGATWTDTSGNLIQAHGGGFLKVLSSPSINSALPTDFYSGELDVVLAWRRQVAQ